MQKNIGRIANSTAALVLICMGIAAPILAFKLGDGLSPFFLFAAVFLGPMLVGTGIGASLEKPLLGAVLGPVVGMLGYYIFFTWIFRVS